MSEIRRALDAAMARQLRPIALAGGLLYGLYAASSLALTEPPALVLAWAATSGLCLGVAAVARRVRPGFAHPLAALLALVIAADSTLLVSQAGPAFSVVLVLVLVGFAILFLSLPWFALVVAATLAGFAAVAARAPPDPLWSGMAFLVVSGAVVALLAQWLRVRVHERLEAARLRLRALADASMEGIAIHDGARIVEANAAFRRLFGEDAVGRSVAELLVDDATGRGARGRTFPIEVARRELPGEGLHVVAVRDVSALARAREMEAKDAWKSRFMNAAAHELSTPLTPVKLQAHMLRAGALGPLNERQQRAMDVLARNVDHLSVLVRDVVDSAKAQAGRLELRRAPEDVGALLATAAESFAAAAQQKGVGLETRAAPGIVAPLDGARFNQVLFNLLGNALKFTPPGGRVLAEAAAEGDAIVVRVADTGPGLTPQQIGSLFQPFTQVHETPEEGTGLGLYIARTIVEAHGGTIAAASEGQGRGATFTVRIPRDPPPPPPATEGGT